MVVEKALKILIIRFSSIGDIVLTTPIIRALKIQGHHQIHYLTKKQFHQVLDGSPYIDKTHILDNNLKEIIEDLKKEKFDFIVDLHKNLRSLRVKLALKKPSASFNKLNRQKWLMVNLKINTLPDIHIVDRYFEAVRSLGIINDLKGLDYFFDEKDHIDKDNLPAEYKSGYIAFVIGGKHKTKIFPQEKIVSLCKKIKVPVIIMGGPDDKDLGESVVHSAGGMILNTCGKYNINQSASIVKQSLAVITNDTGLMHIAAAFEKPIISIWGNTIPEFGMYPYQPAVEPNHSMMAEVKGLKCRPCSKIGYSRCPRKHFRCMMDIDEAAILDFLDETIQK